MALTAHTQFGPPQAGLDVANNVATVDVVYRITASVGDDDPLAVIAYVRANIADAGAAWSSSRPSCTLKKITPRRVERSAEPWYWDATLNYSDPSPTNNQDNNGGGRDEQGNPTSDPLSWRPEVDYSTHNYERPMTKARYEGGAKDKAHAVLQGMGTPEQEANPFRWTPCNSAFALIGPLMVDDHYGTLTVKRREIALDLDKVKPNVLNKDAFQFTYRGLTKAVKARCAKIQSVQASIEFLAQGDPNLPQFDSVLACTIVVEIIDSPGRTWVHEVVDQGFSARAWIGDPDGKGGTIDDSAGLPIPPGGAPQRRLVDLNGDPISEPALLDGDGQPLDLGGQGGDQLSPVYLKWLGYAEIDFKTECKLLKDVIV